MANLTIGDLNPTAQMLIGALNDVGGPPQTPVAPTAPAVVVVTGDTQLTVSWTVPSDGGSPVRGWQARVYDPAETPPAYTQYPAASFGATFTALENGTTYTVQVLAYNDYGPSTVTTTNGTPNVPQTLPGPPTGLVLTPMDSAVGVSFTAPSSMGQGTFVGYAVTTTTADLTVHTYLMDDTTAKLLLLANDVEVTVQVATVTSAGLSSTVLGFATPTAAPTGVTAPDPPTNLALTPFESAATLTWTAPVSTGTYPLADYLIKAEIVEAAVPIRWYSTTGTTLDIGSLINETTWTVSVYARTAAGRSAAVTGEVSPTQALSTLANPSLPFIEPPPAPLLDGLYPAGYVPPIPGVPSDPDLVEPVPVEAPNIIAFYPVDDERGTQEGVFSPLNWAGVA